MDEIIKFLKELSEHEKADKLLEYVHAARLLKIELNDALAMTDEGSISNVAYLKAINEADKAGI